MSSSMNGEVDDRDHDDVQYEVLNSRLIFKDLSEIELVNVFRITI